VSKSNGTRLLWPSCKLRGGLYAVRWKGKQYFESIYCAECRWCAWSSEWPSVQRPLRG